MALGSLSANPALSGADQPIIATRAAGHQRAATHNSMQPHKFVCERSVLSQDMLANRLIKSAYLSDAAIVSVVSVDVLNSL